MSSTKFNTIMGVTIFKFTHAETAKLLELQRSNRNFYNTLPTYTINDRGFIRYSEEYLQWVDSENESAILFNVEYADPMLQHSISNSGLHDLLEKVDVRPVFNHFTPHTYEEFGKVIPVTNHVVMEVEYVVDRGWEYTEYEEWVHLKGHLDKNMLFVPFLAKDLVLQKV